MRRTPIGSPREIGSAADVRGLASERAKMIAVVGDQLNFRFGTSEWLACMSAPVRAKKGDVDPPFA